MLVRPYAWILLLWALVFSYTWLTYNEVSQGIRSIPVGINIAANIILITFLSKDPKKTKAWLLSLSWSVVICIGILLHIYELINDTAFSILIAMMTGIAASAWCIASHAEHVTEAGLHWYVWIMLIIITLCAGFNGQGETARVVYIIATAVSLISQIYYIIHIFKVQAAGPERRQHVFRVGMSCVIFTTILIGAILIADDSITQRAWYEIIFVVEILSAIVIIVDFIIGFSQQSINYMGVETTEV